MKQSFAFDRHARALLVCVALVSVLASSCATSEVGCAAGERSAIVQTLYFGTAKPDGVVTPEEWQAFVDREIAPRFPDGFTVWPAAGEWRNADGSVAREMSWVLQIVTFDASKDASLQSIVDAYKKQFQQEAVMRVHYPSCVSFSAGPR